ncbi:hypothetical protein [Thiocystis violacea]|uniref:hypothetical protein n=1 Tax=Thiocystis violacea TaxID=13725 RepID=UPI001905E62B|nr:hypothetical protein [Thiocystis violacea]MBK1717024.1 hypothetical protein [Thiocystis violacea]
MNHLNVTAIAAAIGLIFSAGTIAETLSKEAYKAAESRIGDEYKSDKANCDSLTGNKKDICRAEAKGKEKVAEAELEAKYEPSAKHDYKVLVAKAEADYAIAEEKCDELSGNDEDVCVKEAKAVETRLKADAEARMTISDAKTEADETSSVAGVMERDAEREASQKALTQTRDANYAVAKEKCETLEGGDQARCKDEAKKQYSK